MEKIRTVSNVQINYFVILSERHWTKNNIGAYQKKSSEKSLISVSSLHTHGSIFNEEYVLRRSSDKFGEFSDRVHLETSQV